MQRLRHSMLPRQSLRCSMRRSLDLFLPSNITHFIYWKLDLNITLAGLSRVVFYEAPKSCWGGLMKQSNAHGAKTLLLTQSLQHGTDLYSNFTALQYA